MGRCSLLCAATSCSAAAMLCAAQWVGSTPLPALRVQVEDAVRLHGPFDGVMGFSQVMTRAAGPGQHRLPQGLVGRQAGTPRRSQMHPAV